MSIYKKYGPVTEQELEVLLRLTRAERVYLMNPETKDGKQRKIIRR